ncbi:hypothetical protein [Amycolatopsis sp. NPDC004079]|uniref:hypothetical protein n=1 Tax=Amycolatopsis sp. NPDC004079 TaxID=3154549 RepID=UPI0033B356A7
MDEYSWPDERLVGRARAAWAATIESLPVGTSITGKVIGRQRFGVFVRIDGVPDALGLVEVTALPCGTSLPAVGDAVVGEVLWHAAHNHQIRIRPSQR